MVTADRPEFVARAVKSFEQQTYSACELIVVDDGHADIRPILRASSASKRIRHIRLERSDEVTLGDLRNISIDAADGEWLAQWDDDDWSHPMRVQVQLTHAQALEVGASALKWTLVHIDGSHSVPVQFRADCGIATPGTILWRRSTTRYPSLRKNEDGVFLRAVRRELGLAPLNETWAHLYVRVHHGGNTWDELHFRRKLTRTPAARLEFMRHRLAGRGEHAMRAFQLTAAELSTLNDLASASREQVLDKDLAS
jgi:glycosyltransferase involved in cell wall biosynthesis